MPAQSPQPEKKESSNPAPLINAWALIGQIGLILALPLAVAVPIGVKLDRLFGTLPLCIFAALLLSLAISTSLIWQKIKSIG